LRALAELNTAADADAATAAPPTTTCSPSPFARKSADFVRLLVYFCRSPLLHRLTITTVLSVLPVCRYLSATADTCKARVIKEQCQFRVFILRTDVDINCYSAVVAYLELHKATRPPLLKYKCSTSVVSVHWKVGMRLSCNFVNVYTKSCKCYVTIAAYNKKEMVFSYDNSIKGHIGRQQPVVMSARQLLVKLHHPIA